MSHRHTSRVLTIVILFALMLIAFQFSGGRAAAAGGISISDVTHVEGNTGTTAFVFTISLDSAVLVDTTVSYTTADNTAVATVGSPKGDYTTKSGTATILAGATSTNVTVLVNGDTLNEANETFFVNLTNNAAILDGQGLGTITNDDAA